jgi:Leucine-rich repeat (LRR) protein
MKIRILLLLIFTGAFIKPVKVFGQVAVQDSLALVDLYNSTNGTDWTNNTNWLSAQPVRTWAGVQVKSNRVTAIYADDNNMVGSLPSSIGNLSNIDTLALYGNQLSGNIPSAMGNLAQLIYLDLGSNQLTGSIPASFSTLSNLRLIALNLNQLSGTIPSYLSSLPNLYYLDIDNNQFTGTIPSSFGSFPKIQYLILADNQLTGTMLASFGNLTQLKYLDVSGNQLTGNIPSSLSSLTQIISINMADNQLSGTIPAALDNISTISSLESFDFLDNHFTFAGMEGLVQASGSVLTYSPQSTILPLSKHNNTLSVSAGGTLSNNTYTWYANGGYNPVATITGDSTFTATSLASYSVAVTNSVATQLTLYSDSVNAGPYIACSSQDSLALVDLYNSTNGPGWTFHTNWLAGPVSSWYGVSIVNGRVDQLLLFNNNLQGSLPASLGNLANITLLGIDGNPLTGSIPSSIGNLTQLQGLDLSNDSLSGSVPSSFSALVNLTSLYLSNNKLTGSIPSSFSGLPALVDLEFNNNQFAGSIPSSLSNLTQLQYLDISDNLLTGNIPSSFSTLAQLQYLDVSNNQLSGTIPSALDSSTSLQTFNLFGNAFNFSGLEGLAQAYTFASYYTQANLVITKTGNNKLSVSAGGTLANNVYTWYHNNVSDTSIAGDSTYTPVLSGSYWVSVTNSIATALALNSDAVNVTSQFCPSPGSNDSVILSANCTGYTLGNYTHFSSGDYIDTLHSVGGCDSIVHLHLTLPALVITYDTATNSGCSNTYTLGSNTYFSSGDYMDTLHSVGGCDSVVSLHLTISKTKTVTTLADNGPGSLRTLVANSCIGDTIRFAQNLISNGSATIILDSEIALGNDVVFKGLYNSNGDTLYISGKHASRIFDATNIHSLILDSMVLINGTSGGDGGAVSMTTSGIHNDSVLLNNSIIRNCISNGSNGGGAIYCDNKITVNNSLINNNSAPNGGSNGGGGGIFANNIATVTNSTITNNTTRVHGGGIYAYNEAIVDHSNITNNVANQGAGGGIFIYAFYTHPATSVIATNSTISNNSTLGASGGGISADNDIIVTNCTISNNFGISGGGIVTQNKATVTNSTIIINRGSGGNGVWAGSINATGSIIAANSGSDIAGTSTITSGGYNIFTSVPSGIVSSDQTGITVIQLNLGSLQNNGGATLTMLPGAGSIAIGRGNPNDSTPDQRGYFISKDTVRDVGAVCTKAASVCSWNGSTSSAWENPANWSCSAVPGASTDVIINSGTVILSSNTTIRSLTINPGASFTIISPYNLTITH